MAWEVEDFIRENFIDEAAAKAIRNVNKEVRDIVMNAGNLEDAKNPSAALMIRIRDVTNRMNKGAKNMPFNRWGIRGRPGRLFKQREEGVEDAAHYLPVDDSIVPSAAGRGRIAEQVEQFIVENGLDEHAARSLRAAKRKVRKAVLGAGRLEGCKNPSAALIVRLRDITQQMREDADPMDMPTWGGQGPGALGGWDVIETATPPDPEENRGWTLRKDALTSTARPWARVSLPEVDAAARGPTTTVVKGAWGQPVEVPAEPEPEPARPSWREVIEDGREDTRSNVNDLTKKFLESKSVKSLMAKLNYTQTALTGLHVNEFLKRLVGLRKKLTIEAVSDAKRKGKTPSQLEDARKRALERFAREVSKNADVLDRFMDTAPQIVEKSAALHGPKAVASLGAALMSLARLRQQAPQLEPLALPFIEAVEPEVDSVEPKWIANILSAMSYLQVRGPAADRVRLSLERRAVEFILDFSFQDLAKMIFAVTALPSPSQDLVERVVLLTRRAIQQGEVAPKTAGLDLPLTALALARMNIWDHQLMAGLARVLRPELKGLRPWSLAALSWVWSRPMAVASDFSSELDVEVRRRRLSAKEIKACLAGPEDW